MKPSPVIDGAPVGSFARRRNSEAPDRRAVRWDVRNADSRPGTTVWETVGPGRGVRSKHRGPHSFFRTASLRSGPIAAQLRANTPRGYGIARSIGYPIGSHAAASFKAIRAESLRATFET